MSSSAVKFNVTPQTPPPGTPVAQNPVHLVKSVEQVTLQHPLQQVFVAGNYHIQQPFIQITQEGYQIQSEDLTEKYNAVRPRHIFRNILARLGGTVSLLATFFISLGIAVAFISKIHSKPLAAFFTFAFIIGGLAASVTAYIFISRLIAPKRKLSLFADSNPNQPLMTISPTSSIFLFNREFEVKDSDRKSLFYFRKNFVDSIFLKKWHAYTTDNKYLFSAKEDSLVMAMLRNYLNLGRLIPLHFNFVKNEGKPFGKFIRRISLRDKYKLEFKNASIDS
jgi:hypothetical protein